MVAKVKRKNEVEIDRREVEKIGSSWQNSLLILTFFIAISISIFFAVRQNQQIEPKSEKVSMDELMAKVENKVEVEKKKCENLRYWGLSLNEWHDNPTLRTMNRVFKRLNYEFVDGGKGDDWDIWWMLDTLFNDGDKNKTEFAGYDTKVLKPHQKINHFPGISTLVNKVDMCERNQGSKWILPTFVLPYDKDRLQKYIEENPTKKVLEKNFYNRGVKIVDAKSANASDADEFFYQEFMENHFLIDGHAFDFGVFVLITSFDPLRVYRFNADVLLRFCAKKYHPFDPAIRDKYVVRGESKTVYEMPSFKETYKNYGFPSRIMFENHIEKKGFDVKSFWKRIDEAIVSVVLNAERSVVKRLKMRNETMTGSNCFELVRFDLVLDADLNPYVVEVNMSPNLTPAGKKYEENILIYEQLVHNTVKMIGGGSYHEYWARFDSSDILVSNKKNIAGDMKECFKFDCRGNCERTVCAFCGPCVTPQIRYQMKESFREHQHSSNFKRLFPSPIYFNNETFIESMTKNNRISLKWHKGMCATDDRWC